MNPQEPLRASNPSIDDLPNELLTKIFHFVRDYSTTQFSEPPKHDPYDKEWFRRPEFISPRFPSTLAQVSTRWHSIIAVIPEFWAILVLAVDISKPISLSDVQASLDRGSGLPLDILITRRPDSRKPTAEEERSYLSPIILLLGPYFPRCRSISVYTTHSSALPKLGRDLTGELPNLVELKLECEIQDDSDNNNSTEWHPVVFPVLCKLVTDGRNFTAMTSMNLEWPNLFPELRSLSIVGLSPRPPDTPQPTSLYDFLETIASDSMHLDFLRFHNAQLTNSFSEEFSVDLNLSKALILEDLDRSFVRELLVSVTLHSPELHVTRSSLNGMGRVPGTAALRLENIALSDSLPGHLKNWYGESLTLVFCEGVNDEFLDMLGSVSTFSGAPNLTKLTIVDCEHFTWEALRKMVEARSKAKKGAIEELIVRGRGPSIGADEAAWLKGQLKSLEWDTWVGHGLDRCRYST